MQLSKHSCLLITALALLLAGCAQKVSMNSAMNSETESEALAIYRETEVIEGYPSSPIYDFFYCEPDDSVVSAEDAEKSAAYAKYIDSLAHNSDYLYQDDMLQVEAARMLAINDMTILSWTITNHAPFPIYISSNELLASYEGIEYDLCGGHCWQDLILRQGECAEALFTGVLMGHAKKGDGIFKLEMSVFQIDENTIPDAYASGDTLSVNELSLPDDFSRSILSIPITMEEGWTVQPLRFENGFTRKFDGYTFELRKAELNAVNAEFEYARIYDSKKEALAHSPVNFRSDYWDYSFAGSWYRQGYGDLSDDPVPLEDGRWAWMMNYKVYYMIYLPEEVILELTQYHEADHEVLEEESIRLLFDYNMI